MRVPPRLRVNADGVAARAAKRLANLQRIDQGIAVPREQLVEFDKRIHLDTIPGMFSVLQTQEFQDWLDDLKDTKAQLRIVARLRLAEAGNLGDWKPVGGEVSEMRIAWGPGYRLYFTKRQNILVVMLAGGDKSTQARDIKRAQKILQQLELE